LYRFTILRKTDHYLFTIDIIVRSTPVMAVPDPEQAMPRDPAWLFVSGVSVVECAQGEPRERFGRLNGDNPKPYGRRAT
jgi:hypothetical protein